MLRGELRQYWKHFSDRTITTMTRVLLIIVFCTVIKAWGQNTKTTSYGLNKRVASFSIVGQIQTSLNTPYVTTLINKEYIFDNLGRLQVEIDSIMNSKKVYQYNRKGNCIKILEYKNDTLNTITYLEKERDKILFKFERNGLMELTGHYIVDKYDRIIEMASFDKTNNTIVYKTNFNYDNNSLVKSWTHSMNGGTMTTEFTNTIIQRDRYQNWIHYDTKSNDVMTKESIYRRTIRYR